jgi:hypothetical protein
LERVGALLRHPHIADECLRWGRTRLLPSKFLIFSLALQISKLSHSGTVSYIVRSICLGFLRSYHNFALCRSPFPFISSLPHPSAGFKDLREDSRNWSVLS